MDKLRKRARELRDALKAAYEKAESEGRALTEEERTDCEAKQAELDNVIKDLEARSAFEASAGRLDLPASPPETPAADPPEGRHVTVGADREAERPFGSFGDQLMAVVRAGTPGMDVDKRLLRVNDEVRAATGMSEAVPSDGGFLVQTDYAAGILQRTYDIGEVLSRVMRLPISANSNGMTVKAVDESSRADGSRWGGVQAFWANEADAYTDSHPTFREENIKLQKVIGLVYATDEELQDAAFLEAFIDKTLPQELKFKVEDAIINGTGAGQPLGILSSPALITQAKDSGDSGATVSTNDVLNMNARQWDRSKGDSRVWFINRDVEPKLYSLTLGSGTAVTLLYTPPGAHGNQYGMLLGAPVVPVEYCATLGTPGDIILCDPDEYLLIDKNGIQSASSIHVRFLYGEQVFRFTYRVNGQPVWNKPLTPKNGSNTLSPFVALATRS